MNSSSGKATGGASVLNYKKIRFNEYIRYEIKTYRSGRARNVPRMRKGSSLRLALPLWLLLRDSQLLKEDVSAIKYDTCVAFPCALLAAKLAELRGLDFARCFLVRGCDITQKLSLNHAGLLHVRINLAANLVACVYN